MLKKGEGYKPKNHWPVSLTSISCKLLEPWQSAPSWDTWNNTRPFVCTIMGYMEQHPTLCLHHHGIHGTTPDPLSAPSWGTWNNTRPFVCTIMGYMEQHPTLCLHHHGIHGTTPDPLSAPSWDTWNNTRPFVCTIMGYMEQHPTLCLQQHGFHRGRSCESQLLGFVDEVFEALKKGCQDMCSPWTFVKCLIKQVTVHKLQQ